MVQAPLIVVKAIRMFFFSTERHSLKMSNFFRFDMGQSNRRIALQAPGSMKALQFADSCH